MSGSDRPPVAARVRRNTLDDVLRALAQTMAQLENAVSAFSPDFDPVAFDAAWYSKDPQERNRATLVRSNMDDLHNLCQTLIGLGVRVAQDMGAIPADRKTPAADQLRGLGLYPEETERVTREVNDLRNKSQHEYWILEPDAVHRAVNHQRQHLPSFIVGVGAWIEDLTD